MSKISSSESVKMGKIDSSGSVKRAGQRSEVWIGQGSAGQRVDGHGRRESDEQGNERERGDRQGRAGQNGE